MIETSPALPGLVRFRRLLDKKWALHCFQQASARPFGPCHLRVHYTYALKMVGNFFLNRYTSASPYLRGSEYLIAMSILEEHHTYWEPACLCYILSLSTRFYVKLEDMSKGHVRSTGLSMVKFTGAILEIPLGVFPSAVVDVSPSNADTNRTLQVCDLPAIKLAPCSLMVPPGHNRRWCSSGVLIFLGHSLTTFCHATALLRRGSIRLCAHITPGWWGECHDQSYYTRMLNSNLHPPSPMVCKFSSTISGESPTLLTSNDVGRSGEAITQDFDILHILIGGTADTPCPFICAQHSKGEPR
jgi:hypothetical protein